MKQCGINQWTMLWAISSSSNRMQLLVDMMNKPQYTKCNKWRNIKATLNRCLMTKFVYCKSSEMKVKRYICVVCAHTRITYDMIQLHFLMWGGVCALTTVTKRERGDDITAQRNCRPGGAQLTARTRCAR